MVNEQISTGTQNRLNHRSNRRRSYGRRILCLILALVLTITGLPAGGVEEAKARVSSVMLGVGNMGNWDSDTKTLTVNGAGTADEYYAWYDRTWDTIKDNVETIVFGSYIDRVEFFSNMSKLKRIQFNNPNGVTLNAATTFKYLPALKQVILPASVPDSVRTTIVDVINANSRDDTASNPISFERQYTINVASGKFDNGSNRKIVTTSRDFETITLKIEAVRPDKADVIFDKWVVKKDGVTELIEGVDWDGNSTAASPSAILKLTLKGDTPSTIYVAATFEQKESINYQTALDQIWMRVRSYNQDQELDKAPETCTVQQSLTALLKGMSEMAGNIFSSFTVNVSDPTGTSATTQSSGTAEYAVTLTATPASSGAVNVTTSGALSFKLKKKVNRSYTVIVEGGTINGESESPSNKVYSLFEIENSGESLPITFTSESKKDKGLSYNGWTVEPNTVTLSAITATTATGSAMLTLTEESPSRITVTAKYKTSGQSQLDWNPLFDYLNGQILQDYKTEAERYIIDSATVPSAAAVQSALKERLDKEIARSNVLDEEGCSYTVTGPAIQQDATTDADGKAEYEIALTLKKANDGESETRKYDSGYDSGLILKIPKKRSTTTGGGNSGDGNGGSGTGSTGGGWVPTTPTTPEKPKEEEKPKEPEKPTDAEKTDPETPTPTDPTPASKPISTTTKTNTATVSVSDLKKAVNDKTNAGMTVKYKNATLTFDAKAVESIVKQAKKIGSSSLKVVCKADAQSSLNSAQKKALKNKTVIGCYQVYLKCGNKTISDFGKGKVKVKVPLKLKSGQKSKNVKLYYVDEKGKLTKQTASYSNGKLTFTTTHFSIYAAIYRHLRVHPERSVHHGKGNR